MKAFDIISRFIVYVGYISNLCISLYLLINFDGIERRTSIAQAYLQTIFVSISVFLSFLVKGILFSHEHCKYKNDLVKKKWEKYELIYTAFTLTLYLTSTIGILSEVWFFLVDNVQGVNNVLPILLVSQLMINAIVFAFNFLLYQKTIHERKRGSSGSKDNSV